MEKGKNIAIGVLVAAVSACAPTAAVAGTLLSGYGGPGQGSQAVLGAKLLGGPGKGSGGSSGGSPRGGSGSGSASQEGGAGSAGGEGSGGAAPASGNSAGSSSAGSASGGTGASHPAAPVKHKGRGSRGSSGSRSTAPAATALAAQNAFIGYTAAQRASAGSPLGISGEDLLYVILVLGVLAMTGVLTARMASERAHAGAKRSRGAA